MEVGIKPGSMTPQIRQAKEMEKIYFRRGGQFKQKHRAQGKHLNTIKRPAELKPLHETSGNGLANGTGTRSHARAAGRTSMGTQHGALGSWNTTSNNTPEIF